MCDERRECVVRMPLPPDMTYTTGHFHNSTGTGSKFLPIHHPKNDFERFTSTTPSAFSGARTRSTSW
jgi:hypothetical protein